LLVAAGASFVARVTLYEPPVVADIVAQAIDHRGFSFVELISDCPVYYGRYNDLGEGPEMLMSMRSRDAAISQTLAGKAFVGALSASAAAPARPAGLATGILHRG